MSSLTPTSSVPASDRFEPPQALVKFLENHGAAHRAHSGRRLLDHLKGTYRVLKRWGCADDVCAAGLFHSIYGTSTFGDACLEVDHRAAVRDAIGHDAELLVYLFSLADRPRGLLMAPSALTIRSRISGTEYSITRRQATDLVTIECANLSEQGDDSLTQAISRLSGVHAAALLDFANAPDILANFNRN